VLLTFLSYTGARISEVLNARVSGIKDESDTKIVITKEKGPKIRKTPLHPKTLVCSKRVDL
jgi:integrase